MRSPMRFEEASAHIPSRAYHRMVDRSARVNRLAPYLAIGPLERFLAHQRLYVL